MNTQTPIRKDGNAKKKFNDINPHLKSINSHVLQALRHKQSYDTSVAEALGCTLELGYLFAAKQKEDGDDDWNFLKDFLEAHGARWTAKCDTSFFHGLVSVAFNQVDGEGKSLHSAPTLSKYRAVLRFAYERNLTAKMLVAKLAEVSLEDYYNTAVSHFRFDPLDHHVEDVDARFLRSLRHLNKQQGLPRIAYSKALQRPKSIGGFATAVVRVRKESMQVLGFTDETGGDVDAMRAKVSSLVPAEAKRRRKKLADRELYWLYATCDLYRRFLPKIADHRAWKKAAEEAGLPLLDEGSTDAEILDYYKHRKQLNEQRTAKRKGILDSLDANKTPSATLKKFVHLVALEFVQRGGNCRAWTITTYPNTPCIEAIVPRHVDGQQAQKIAMRALDAQRFVTEFPQLEDWTKEHEAGIVTLKQDGAKKVPFRLQDLTGMALWRVVDPALKSVARFSMNREILHDLERWREEYAQIPRIGRRAFQSIVKLGVDGNDLVLIHPLDDDHQRVMGAFVSGSVPVFSQPRFFDFKICEKLIQLALDYGVGFEFDLLKGREGLSALRVHPIDYPVEASVTLPLMLSNKGNPAEITSGVV